MHLVNEQDNAPFRLLNFIQHGLQAFLEFTAELCPRNQCAHVERKQAFAFQAFWYVAINNAQRESFGDCRFTHTGLTNQDRVVLRPARQDLDRTADFFVAPDNRVELAFPRILGQVAGVFFQGFIAFFGIFTVSSATLTEFGNGAFEARRGHARIGQHVRSRITLQTGDCQQQAFNGDKTVASFLCVRFGSLEQLGPCLLET